MKYQSHQSDKVWTTKFIHATHTYFLGKIHQGLQIFKQIVICLGHTVCVRGIEIYD